MGLGAAKAAQLCSVEGCVNTLKASVWCASHYARWRRHGDPSAGGPPKIGRRGGPFQNWEARFWAKVDRNTDSGCWEWTRHINDGGYGICSTPLGNRAHRVSWTLHNGPIPSGLFVCHHCDNRKCVNPSHLFLGTAADNVRDRDQKGRRAPPRITDITGQRFGSLVAVALVGRFRNGATTCPLWECRCDCGNVRICRSRSLLRPGGISRCANDCTVNPVQWRNS